MITVTRRNGTAFALNPDLIERVEATPDTVITLVSGTKYVVSESVERIVEEVCNFRAAVLMASAPLASAPSLPTMPSGDTPAPPKRLRSVSTPEN